MERVGVGIPVFVVIVFANTAAASAQAVPDGFVQIEAGRFTMGSPQDPSGEIEDETQHRVRITRDFYLQTHEVTQAEWMQLMDVNPSLTDCGEACPVETVNWYEALAYANALSREQGLEECYTLSNCFSQPGNEFDCSDVSFDGLDCAGYRLPTEAEWEYAVRAGTTEATYNGDLAYQAENCGIDTSLEPIAWYCANSTQETHPVGQREPNSWGLHDMLGNVWEWVWDCYGEYGESPVMDPTGPSSCTNRVLRGGSWGSISRVARASQRRSVRSSVPVRLGGFRLARSVNPSR